MDALGSRSVDRRKLIIGSACLIAGTTLPAVAGTYPARPVHIIVPSTPGVRITAAVSGASRGWYRLRVQIGGRQLTFLVSAGGDIQPG